MVNNLVINLEKIPYTDILCFEDKFYRDLIYRLQKILEFIADDGQANLAKSIFNVNHVNSLECLVAEDKYDINLRLYTPRSFEDSHIKLYYIDEELERDPNDIASISYTTKVNYRTVNQRTYNTFIFGREIEDDKYLISLFANIVKKEIDLRFYEETGFSIISPHSTSSILGPNNRNMSFIDLFDLSWNYINKYIEADFILHLYGTYFKILDEVLDLKYDQFDMVYNNEVSSLDGDTEYEIIKKIYDTAISHEPLYIDEMCKFIYNKINVHVYL